MTIAAKIKKIEKQITELTNELKSLKAEARKANAKRKATKLRNDGMKTFKFYWTDYNLGNKEGGKHVTTVVAEDQKAAVKKFRKTGATVLDYTPDPFARGRTRMFATKYEINRIKEVA